jgi:hypothetical protein
VKVNDLVDFDVTAAVTADGTYNFALDTTNGDAADYRSREDGLAPTLIVTLTGNPPTVAISQPANNAGLLPQRRRSPSAARPAIPRTAA